MFIPVKGQEGRGEGQGWPHTALPCARRRFWNSWPRDAARATRGSPLSGLCWRDPRSRGADPRWGAAVSAGQTDPEREGPVWGEQLTTAGPPQPGDGWRSNTHVLFVCPLGPSWGSGCSPRTGACGNERRHVRNARMPCPWALLECLAAVPGVSGGLLVQQQLLLLFGELQVQLERVVVQVVDVLLDVAAGPLRGRGLVWRQRVRGAGLGHLHVAELAQEVVVLGQKSRVSTDRRGTPQKPRETAAAHISVAVLVVLRHGRQVGGELGGRLQMQVAPGDGVKEGVLLQGGVSSHLLTADPLGRVLGLKGDQRNEWIKASEQPCTEPTLWPTSSCVTRSLALGKNFSGNSYSSLMIFWKIRYSFLRKRGF